MKKQLTVILLFACLCAKAQIGIGTTTPNSTLDVRGSVSAKYTSFTGSTAAGTTDNMLVFTGTSAATLTMPDAAACQGRIYWIKNASTNSSTLTVATTSSQTIDGLSSWVLAQTHKVIRIVSDGTNWLVASESVPGNSGTAWIHGGNSVSALQNLGTTSNFDLPFITNNTEKMRLSTGGNLGIGASSFNSTYPERLLVDAGSSGNTNYQNVIVGKGNTNSYAQLNIQNANAGTAASSDVVATANNGDETINFIDMGINSSANTSGAMGGSNDAYLYNTGQNLLIGTGTASKSLIFMTGGTAQATNERMRITGTGNVGIGTASPAYKLHISGANPLFLAGVQTGANTDSIMTILNGVVKKIHPSALTTSSSNAWALIGNASTNPTTNFIGTTDAEALVIKENNTQVGRFEANSIAFGNGATTNNATNSYTLGTGANIGFNKTNAFAIGNSAALTADNSFALGNSSSTTASNAFSIGNSAAANSVNSFAIGPNASVGYSITDAISIGDNATTSASNSIAIGSNSVVASKTQSNAASAISIGNAANANSANAIAMGTGAITGYNLTSPVAIGNGTTANGNNAVALGNTATIGFVSNSTALGAATSISGSNSTAVGYNTSVTQSNAIILGDRSNTSLAVGIGTENFSGTNREKLLVDAGASGGTSFQNVIVGKGNTDSYAQLNIQNGSGGASASSDVVSTANNGNETINFIDMGINGGGNTTTGVLGGANTAYLYSTGNDFAIGNATSAKNLNFFTTNAGTYTERMRITSTGNVGIANTAPSEKLDITGNVRFSGALMPNNQPGVLGSVLVSSGAGAAPTWQDGTSYIANTAWLQGGNTFTGINNFGTISNHDIPVITNNIERMRVTNTGNVGIGTSSFTAANPERLIVNAGTPAVSTDFQNVIVGKGNTNSYAQLNIQNINAGTGASSDVVATANNGNETVNFIDMGINSGGNTSTGVLGGVNTAYLYSTASNFVIGNSTSGKDLSFYTTSGTSTERMKILSTGHVGINATAPVSTLDVNGSAGTGIVVTASNITLDATNATVILSNGSVPVVTLPSAASGIRRMYIIVNQTAGTRTISAYMNFLNVSTTTIPSASSITIQSDGTNWYQIR